LRRIHEAETIRVILADSWADLSLYRNRRKAVGRVVETSKNNQRNVYRGHTVGEMLLQETPKQRTRIWWIRKSVQATSTVLLMGATLGVARAPIVLPVLLTLGNSEKTVVNALDAIQEMLAEPILPWMALAVFLLFGIFAGRATCGWICPFGLVQDLLAEINPKRREVSLRTHKGSLKLKYGILGMTLFVSGSLGLSLFYGLGSEYKVALGVLARGPFSALSPEATLLGVLPILSRVILLYFLGIPPVASPLSLDLVWNRLSSMSWLLTIRLAVLILVVVMSFYIMRAWCRYLCPAGAFLAISSRFSFLGLRRNLLQCDRCGDCVRVCPMLVRITEQPWEKMTDPECIMCLECVDACSLRAIRPTFP